MTGNNVPVVNSFVAKLKNRSTFGIPIQGHSVTLLKARHPGIAVKKKHEIRMRLVRLGCSYLAIIDGLRKSIPKLTPQLR